MVHWGRETETERELDGSVSDGNWLQEHKDIRRTHLGTYCLGKKIIIVWLKTGLFTKKSYKCNVSTNDVLTAIFSTGSSVTSRQGQSYSWRRCPKSFNRRQYGDQSSWITMAHLASEYFVWKTKIRPDTRLHRLPSSYFLPLQNQTVIFYTFKVDGTGQVFSKTLKNKEHHQFPNKQKSTVKLQ